MAEIAPQPTAPPRPFRWQRLLQYRLRSLFIVMTAVAVWLGWWTHTARRQRAAVAALIEANANVGYDFHARKQREPRYWPDWAVKALGVDYCANVENVSDTWGHLGDAELANLEHFTSLRTLLVADKSFFRGNQQITDAGLQYLANLTKLRRLVLRATNISGPGLVHLRGLNSLERLHVSLCPLGDQGLENLQGLTKLKELDLGGTRVSDAGLENFAGLTELRILELQGTKVTGPGLKHLQALPRLVNLNLYGTRLTDEGLMHLQNAKSLKVLGLANTQVSDNGVQHLTGLTSLVELDLVGSKVTTAGYTRLKQALPQCDIKFFDPHATIGHEEPDAKSPATIRRK